jgi:hypothetical protein
MRPQGGKTAIASVTLLVALLLSFATPSVAQGQSRQTFDLGFTTQHPASPTGFSEAIEYTSPSSPEDKPPAVQTVVLSLAPGAKVDTSAPARCGASDLMLMVQGTAACPAASKVGAGEVSLDTGISGPARTVQTDVTLLNSEKELIFLFQERSTGARSVSRAQISGGTFTSEAPPIPGGPPDGFTALKQVRLGIDPVQTVRGGRRLSYITAPGSCPRNRQWINTATFTYRDGISQTVKSASPCRGRSAP